MASFADYTEFVEPLRLGYQGKQYEIPPVGIQDNIRLGLALEADRSQSAGEEFEAGHILSDEEYERILLGPVLDEMKADNVPAGFVRRVLGTAIADFRNGRDFAEMFWATDGSPKAMAAWIAAKEASEPSTNTGEATSTPSPARTSGTRTSPPKPKQSRAKTGTGSRPGTSSSRSGGTSKRTSTPSTASTSTPQDPSGE